MYIKFIEIKGNVVAEIISNEIVINKVQDALDIMADCSYNGANAIVLSSENLSSDFFDLKTKLAGEILQKFTNYRVKLAITGDFSNYNSKSLNDFIYESNKHGQIIFVKNLTEAIEIFSKN